MNIGTLFAILVIISVCMILLAQFGPGGNKTGNATNGSLKPIVNRAEFCDGWLNLQVIAGHPDIVKELPLPHGALISNIRRNRLYLAECPVPLQGNEMSDREIYEAAVELARACGFRGRVRQG